MNYLKEAWTMASLLVKSLLDNRTAPDNSAQLVDLTDAVAAAFADHLG